MKRDFRALARLLTCLMAVVLVAGACGDDSTAEESSPTTTAAAASTDGHEHDHEHGDALAEVTYSPVPTIEIEVLEDPMAGWNLHATLSGHRLAPEHVSSAAVDGEGHMHLYVDGEKITRLYGEWYFLGELDPGEHEVRVELSANDHAALAVDGEIIDDTVTVTVAGEGGGSDDDMADHEMTDDEVTDDDMADDGTATADGIAVEVVSGAVVGGVQTFEVETGDTVAITVTADVADEVHVHGYDVLADIEPGVPTTIELDARFEGIYEVELESTGLLLLELSVG